LYPKHVNYLVLFSYITQESIYISYFCVHDINCQTCFIAFFKNTIKNYTKNKKIHFKNVLFFIFWLTYKNIPIQIYEQQFCYVQYNVHMAVNVILKSSIRFMIDKYLIEVLKFKTLVEMHVSCALLFFSMIVWIKTDTYLYCNQQYLSITRY
jgi:hypothetical protein